MAYKLGAGGGWAEDEVVGTGKEANVSVALHWREGGTIATMIMNLEERERYLRMPREFCLLEAV